MKKRILALFVATIMLLSAFILAGCKDDVAESSATESTTSETSEAPKVLTPKETLVAALKNALAFTESEESESNLPSLSTEMQDGKLSASFVLNQMEEEGESPIEGLPLSVSLDAMIDYDDTKADALFPFKAQYNGKFGLAGEEIPFGVFMNSNDIVFTNFLGLSEDMYIIAGAVTDALEYANINTALISGYEEIPEIVLDIISKAVEANISEDLFKAETKDVTIEGIEYKGATVVSFTLNVDTAKELLDDIKADVKANETLKEIFGEDAFVEDEDYDLADEFKELRADVTIAAENIVGANLVIDYIREEYDFGNDESYYEDDFEEGECDHGPDDEYYDEEFVEVEITEDEVYDEDDFYFDEDGFYFEDYEIIKVDDTITFTYSVIENGFKFYFDPTTEEYTEDKTFVYSYNPADGALLIKLESKFDDDDDEISSIIKIEGTNKDNKFDGKLIMPIEGTDVQVVFSAEYSETSVKLAITSIAVPVEGTVISFPTDFQIAISATETKTDYYEKLKLDFMGIKIDAEMSMSFELVEVNLEDIKAEDCINYEDADFESFTNKLATLYPNIYAMIFADQNEENEIYY